MLATAESASPAANPLEVPVRGENRLVTVLFAGPTRGVETRHDQDPEEAAAIVNYLLGIMGESASPISSLS